MLPWLNFPKHLTFKQDCATKLSARMRCASRGLCVVVAITIAFLCFGDELENVSTIYKNIEIKLFKNNIRIKIKLRPFIGHQIIRKVPHIVGRINKILPVG